MKIWNDIWISFRALPVWVQIWMAFFLGPVNVASLAFLNEPQGVLIAVLVFSGVLPNFPIIIYERGFSKLMAFPHLVPWTILVGILVFSRPPVIGNYDIYLWILLIVDTISLLFDFPDAVKWWRGDREPARPSIV